MFVLNSLKINPIAGFLHLNSKLKPPSSRREARSKRSCVVKSYSSSKNAIFMTTAERRKCSTCTWVKSKKIDEHTWKHAYHCCPSSSFQTESGNLPTWSHRKTANVTCTHLVINLLTSSNQLIRLLQRIVWTCRTPVSFPSCNPLFWDPLFVWPRYHLQLLSQPRRLENDWSLLNVLHQLRKIRQSEWTQWRRTKMAAVTQIKYESLLFNRPP